MSKPADGNYYIVNRESTSDGTSLAVQFNGVGDLLTVTELGSQPTQVWTLVTSTTEGETDSQAICPEDTGTSYQSCKSGSSNLTVSSADNYTWIVRGTDGIYTVQDRDLKYFWGINSAAVGQDVHYTSGDDKATQNWQLIAA